MPTTEWGGYVDRGRIRREAERQVLAKFPGIIVGSSGWHRAVNNRFDRLCHGA